MLRTREVYHCGLCAAATEAAGAARPLAAAVDWAAGTSSTRANTFLLVAKVEERAVDSQVPLDQRRPVGYGWGEANRE